MARWLALIPVLIIGVALPASAGEQMSDQDARKVAETVLDAVNTANANRNAAGLAALYTKDAVRVTPYGLIAQAEIEPKTAEFYKHSVPSVAKLDQVRAIGNNVIVRTGTWVLKSATGEISRNGYWEDTIVREGDRWEIKMDMWNYAAGMDPTPKK